MKFLSEPKNRLLIIATSSALIFALFTFSFVSIAELKIKAKSLNQVNQITFSGVAEINAEPDLVSFNFRVYEIAPDSLEAESKAILKANKVLDLLQEKGVHKRDIQTRDYRINPKYNYQNHPFYKQILDGYEASQVITVKIRDLGKMGEILGQVSQIEALEVNGPVFEVENSEKLKDKLQVEAINDAKAKAKETAKNLGIKLGKIVRFSEEPTANIFPPRAMMMAKAVNAESFDAAPPQIETGEQKITSRVSITYEIE